MSRSIILDLERRGFIVYVATDDPTQKEDIKSEGKPDILPLHLDITNVHFSFFVYQIRTNFQYAAP